MSGIDVDNLLPARNQRQRSASPMSGIFDTFLRRGQYVKTTSSHDVDEIKGASICEWNKSWVIGSLKRFQRVNFHCPRRQDNPNQVLASI